MLNYLIEETNLNGLVNLWELSDLEDYELVEQCNSMNFACKMFDVLYGDLVKKNTCKND